MDILFTILDTIFQLATVLVILLTLHSILNSIDLDKQYRKLFDEPYYTNLCENSMVNDQPLKKLITFLILAFLALQTYFFVQVVWLNYFNPTNSAFMSAEESRLEKNNPHFQLQYRWKDYKNISIYSKQAVIASEDANFTQHDGVDWDALEKAAKANAAVGKVKRGGSTITMQLSKNLFLSAHQSYLRKAQEILITGMIELVMSKRRILELYLNIAEWGVGVFGIEAASQHYYGISASQLSKEQAAWLAAILPAPRRFDHLRNSVWAEQKAAIITQRMTMVKIP
jgi:monofunctional biosynthetic peptidoglycan transglycosylase